MRRMGRAMLLAGALLLGPGLTHAQYAYLDANGDGINSAADQIDLAGTTTLDVYLNTNHDRNGSAQSCNSHTGAPYTPGAGLDLFSYSLVLKVAPGTGTVSWGAYADSLGFFPVLSDLSNSTDLSVIRTGGSSPLPGGLYKLGRVTFTVLSGVPVIQFSNGTGLDPSASTNFGTTCDASDAPYTYLLGVDWFDVNGIGDRTHWVSNGISVSSATGDQENVVSIPDGYGGVIAAWEDRRSGGRDIYAQRVDSSGRALWALNGVVVCTSSNDQTTPALTSDGSGGAIITWHDERTSLGTGDIYAQRINSSGIGQWTTNGIAVCTAFSYQVAPAIAPDGGTGAIITWQDNRNGTYDIYAQRLNFTGVAQWTADGVVVVSAFIVEAEPRIVADGSGGAIIAWRDYRNGCNCAGSADIYAQAINSTGTVQWATDGVEICTASGDQFAQSIQTDGSGGALVTWTDYRLPGGVADIYAQRVSSTGTVQWTTNGVAICAATGDQVRLSAASDDAGGEIVCWEDHRTSFADIYAQRINSSGTPQWISNGVVVCAASDDQTSPRIVTDASHGAIVVWADNRVGDSSPDIYAQRLDGNGNAKWTTDGVSVCTHSGIQSGVYAVTDGSGGVIATWSDTRSSNKDIFAGRISLQGNSYVSGVESEGGLPASVMLLQNRPNPFNPFTTIEYTTSQAGRVRISVFDAQGKLVRRLVDTVMEAGVHGARWSGEDDAGKAVASGIYFARVDLSGGVSTIRMALLR